MKSYFTTPSLRQLLSRTAVLLALGLTVGSCDKVIDVQPQDSLDASTGIKTRQDAEAALRGCYDILQGGNYYGLRYPNFADLQSGNLRHSGTFPSFAEIANNSIQPNNVEVSNVWNSIYNGINRANFFIEQVATITDPAYDVKVATAEARGLRAFHYMNLLAYWGGKPEGYGQPDGLGVPLRLKPTLATTDTKPIPRSTEAQVVEAIRDDLTFAAANLPNGAGPRLTKGAIIALQARLEMRLGNYAAALALSNQVRAAANNVGLGVVSATPTDIIWQLIFNITDGNALAFFYFPAASGGRNEYDPSASLSAAHPTGDLRLPINVVSAANAAPGFPNGTTRKYSRISSGDDPMNIIRFAEVVLNIAEASVRGGDLATATTQVNAIRTRAGLLPVVLGPAPAPTTPVTPAVAVYFASTPADPDGRIRLLAEVLRQRRLELAHEGHYWFDLRRTNSVQSTLAAPAGAQPNSFNSTFRNLWPIPTREINNSSKIIVQNPDYGA